MVTKILSAIAVFILGVLIYAGLQSPNYMVARETLIKATPEVIFPYINNSAKMNEWMPWQESDPNVNITYTGPSEGVGSKSSWESSGQMGTGQAEIIESIPNQSVKTQLTYTKPMEMSQIAEVSMTPMAEGTLVRWSVSGQNSFIGRIFCLFMNMDKMVGAEFEKGLTKLKNMTETPVN